MTPLPPLLPPRSLARRLTFSLVAGVAALTLVLLLGLHWRLRSLDNDRCQRVSGDYADYLAGALEIPLWNLDLDQIERLCRTVVRNPEIARLRVVDDRGETRFAFERTRETTPVETRPILKDARPLGRVEIGINPAEFAAPNRLLLLRTAGISLGIIAGMAIFTAILLRRLLATPLRDLSLRINHIAEGHYAQAPAAADRTRYTEFSRIISGVELMADQVATRETSLTELNAELAGERASLEARVADRTRELTATVDNLTLYRFILDKASNAIFLIEESGRFMYVNGRACASLGYTAAELSALAVTEISVGMTPERWRSIWSGSVDRHENPAYGLRSAHRRKDGSTFPVEVFTYFVRHDNRPIQVAIVLDITDRVAAENHLRHTIRLSDQALALTRSGYWVVPIDGSGHYFSSERTARLFGDPPTPDWRYSLAHWENGIRAVDPAIAKAVSLAFADACAGKTPFYDATYPYKRPVDGRVVWLHNAGTLVRDRADGVVEMHGVCQDITEIIEARRETEAARRAAEEANRLKSVFLANMSHEIRTPMNAILGYAQLMERDTGIPPDRLARVKTIARAGEHLLAIINDILEMSKIEAGRIALHESSFDLHDLLHNLVELYGERARAKGLSLDLRLLPEVPRHITADEAKLRQAVVNLVGNAVKFTAEGGVTLTVSATPETGGAHRLTFAVADTGPGMTAEERAALFQPFVQTAIGRSTGGGTGLGLAISKQYAALMSGDIRVESEKGAGSTFTLTVLAHPATAADAPGKVELPRVRRLRPGSPPVRVLVVDDIPLNRDLVTALLAPLGFELRDAGDGREAVDLFHAWQPHAILMDMRMPVMDGYEACRLIKDTPAGLNCYILALTASAFEEQKSLVLTAGANGFLRKPFRHDELIALLGENLHLDYEYESDSTPAAPRPAAPAPVDFAPLPRPLLDAATQACRAADYEALLEIAEKIRPEYPDHAAAIRRRLDAYDYAGLLRKLTGGT